MTAIYQDNHVTLYNSDCRDMAELADNSIHCVVTSPPYWGLRKYNGLPDSIWGNWSGQFGLEPTIEMYVQHSVEILRKIKRVLRKDGVVFWNIGDSYAGSGKGASTNPCVLNKSKETYNIGKAPKVRLTNPLKPKDLCLIPFRVALAAQADGWWVRSVIIWNKPNAMPESVTDRPTDAFEYILMLTKSRKYYWDIEATKEPQKLCSIERRKRNHLTQYDSNYPNQKPQKFHCNEAPLGDDAEEILGGRNIRNVWTFPTQPYPDAHFATFPDELPERCIKAATPEYGVCAKCGKPYVRKVVKTGFKANREPAYCPDNTPSKTDSTGWKPTSYPTNEWLSGCNCGAGIIPATVLDPFGGSGTTGWVAKRLNRKCVMYEGSPEYCDLIIKRNQQQAIGV